MPKLSVFALVCFVTLVFSTIANATCPTFHTLTNGSAANADQVMDNFNYILQCPGFTAPVGVGTSSPAARLDLVGNAATGATGDAFRFTETSGLTASRNWLIGNGAGPSYGDLAFLVSAASGGTPVGQPVLNLSKTGYVGINTGTANTLLHLTGNASNYGGGAIRIDDISGQTNSRNWMFGNGAGPNYGDLAFMVSASGGGTPTGTPILNLSRNGNVGINTANPAQALEVNGQIKVNSLASASGTALCINASVIASCSSSRRYKEQIHDASFGLKEIEAMRPVTFKWRGRDEQDFGLIAEEVAKIDPRYVTYKAGEIEGVKYPQLTAVLVNAVKELKAVNDSQAAEIARLRQQSTALFGQIKQQAAEAQDVRKRLGALEHRMNVRTAENRLPPETNKEH